MFIKFLVLEWKSLFRATHVKHSIVIKIFLGILGLLIAVGLLAVGHSMYDLLDENFESVFPMQQVNAVLALWFVSELALRFFMQQLPILQVKPFLIQRITRSSLVHYLLAKSLFSFYNLLAPLVFIPFAIACISAGDYSSMQIVGWLVPVISTSLSLHFFNFTIQRVLSANWKLATAVVAVLMSVLLLEYSNVWPISRQIASYFESVLQYPVLCAAPISLIVAAYVVLFRSLRKSLYLENTSLRNSTVAKTKYLRWLDQMGHYAPLIRLDLQLLWRNKRSKSLLITGMVGLFYGLIFYPNPTGSSSSMCVFVGIFMTGLFTFNFGQFVPAWDSTYYPLLHTQRIGNMEYLIAKSIVLYSAITLSTILTIPYIYFGTDILLINIVAGLYNIGINVPILLYFGCFNKKRVELDKSQFFNYQGMGASQWIVMLPALLIPVILWSIISIFVSFEITCILFGAIGIIGICLRNLLLQRIAKRYHARKYAMLAGFKQVSE